MTRRLRPVLAAVALLLTLTACTTQEQLPTDPEPTLPSFPLDQTPAQKLSAAIGMTAAEETYDIRYGTIVDTQEDAYTQAVSPSSPLDRAQMNVQVPELPDNADFLEAFCNSPLMISPSNTGIVRYFLQNLSWEEARSLLYLQEREAPLADAEWTIAIEVDGAGRLCNFEITADGEGESRSVFVTLTFPESP